MIAPARRTPRAALAAALLAAALAAPAAAHDASRIVAVGGAVTEVLYALGLEGRVVAVDDTSQFPPRALKDKPSVGYLRRLGAEGVLGVNPTLVLASAAAGPPETLRVLEQAAVPLVRVAERFDGEGILATVRAVAAAAGAPERGECLAAAVGADLAALAEMRRRIERPVRALFLLSLIKERAMVGGRATAADGVLALAGAANVFAAMEGYKPVNEEAIIAAAPEVVVVLARSGAGAPTVDEVVSHPAFAATPAARARAVVAVEGHGLSFGPHTAGAARDLAARLMPALAGTVLPSDRAAARCAP